MHGTSRRKFLSRTGAAATGVLAGGLRRGASAAAAKGPHDYIIVEGHRDIWEFNDRFRLTPRARTAPLRDHLLPRLLEGGLDVVIMPAGGDSVAQRGGDPRLLVGSLRVVDMLLTEIEKTNGVVSIIRTQADLPVRSDPERVRIFLDIEGGAPIQVQEPEPEFHRDRRLAMLRNFFRLGIRGMQLTHNGRNMLGVGIAEGKIGTALSDFGVEVVREMNRLGMMIGVSHLSAAGIDHVAKISTRPVASTHTNIQKFINTPRQHSDEEVKAIASTGGVVGVRYIAGRTDYEFLADEIDYMVKLVGVEHVGIGWLGHDVGHPRTGVLPVLPDAPKFSGVEGETMFQHWSRFISILDRRGYSERQIALVLGGNYLRIWKDILPA